MNAVIYHSNNHKKINGTLFYCFEYYSFLKQYLPELNFIILNATEDDRRDFVDIFNEKYIIDDKPTINDILSTTKRTDLIRFHIDNALILDTHTYKQARFFLGHADSIRVYSNDGNNPSADKDTFYGFYDYQRFEKRTRLKFYKDIHRVYKNKGNETFVTFLTCVNIDSALRHINMSRNDVLLKKPNVHNKMLFERVGNIVYWHGDCIDTNNRTVVESFIHDIPITLHNNGHNDSVLERYNFILEHGLNDFILTADDIMISDFIKGCSAGGQAVNNTSTI